MRDLLGVIKNGSRVEVAHGRYRFTCVCACGNRFEKARERLRRILNDDKLSLRCRFCYLEAQRVANDLRRQQCLASFQQ